MGNFASINKDESDKVNFHWALSLVVAVRRALSIPLGVLPSCRGLNNRCPPGFWRFY